MSEEMSIEEQLRIVRGQGEHNQWSMRQKTLDELVDQFVAWSENVELAEVPGVLRVLEGAREAQAHVAEKVAGLAEFAPPKRGKKK